MNIPGLGRGKPPPTPGRIVATYCIFNARDLIYDSLTSVAPFVDEIRVYDGRFTQYRCPPEAPCGGIDHDNSCDGTLKEIELWQREYPSPPQVMVRQWAVMNEASEKRTRMMADVPEGDVVLVIDDDELIFGDPLALRDFAENKPAWFSYIDFLFQNAGHGTEAVIPLARVFVRTPGLKYESYYRIHDDQGLVVDMKADNRMVPYGQRTGNRHYLPPSIRMVELAEFRMPHRTKQEHLYNTTIGKDSWRT